MGHTPPLAVPLPRNPISERKLRARLTWRYSPFGWKRRMAHEACLTLIEHAEIQLGWRHDDRPKPPAKPAEPTYLYPETGYRSPTMRRLDHVAAIYNDRPPESPDAAKARYEFAMEAAQQADAARLDRANRIADEVLLGQAADEEKARYDQTFRWGY